MFSKLTIVLASTASAINLHTKITLTGNWSETCTANQDRIDSEKAFSGQDPSFPASRHALFWPEHNKSDSMKKRYELVNKWARPVELLGGQQPNLWGEKGVLPAGTRQGKLGDCWFLAAASAIAEYPERIKSIFNNQEYPNEGVFQFKFYLKSQPTKIWVDDRLPLNEKGGLMNAQMSENKAWWQPILEKAYAKLNVNYSNLSGGNPAEALRELTGMPIEMFNSKKQTSKEFFQIVSEADDNKFIMTAACMENHNGLVPGHAYTLLGVQELKAGSVVLHQLIKMRNPWGKERYDGPWNDKDERWTDEFKKQAKMVVANDGIFYMTLDDFKKAFTVYNIAHYQKWHTSDVHVKGTGKKFMKSFSTPIDQEIVLTVDYLNKKKIPHGCPIPSLYYNIYIVANGKVEGKPTPVNKQIAHGMKKFKAKKGVKYYALIVNWKDATYESDFYISTYGEKEKAEFK